MADERVDTARKQPRITLNDIIARPESVGQLSAAQRRHLHMQCAAVSLALSIAPDEEPAANVDRLVPLEEAAPRLAWTRDFAYRHWKETDGFFKDVDGRVKIPASRLAKYIVRAGR
jgi:hypothetical protein